MRPASAACASKRRFRQPVAAFSRTWARRTALVAVVIRIRSSLVSHSDLESTTGVGRSDIGVSNGSSRAALIACRQACWASSEQLPASVSFCRASSAVVSCQRSHSSSGMESKTDWVQGFAPCRNNFSPFFLSFLSHFLKPRILMCARAQSGRRLSAPSPIIVRSRRSGRSSSDIAVPTPR